MNVIIDEDVDEHKAIYYWMIHKLICSSLSFSGLVSKSTNEG